MAEGESVEEAEGKKKGGIKGWIIKLVPLLLIVGLVLKMTVLKPPPPTAAQLKAQKAVAERTLEIKCSLANNRTPPAPLGPDGNAPKDTKTATTVATTPATAEGPILSVDSVTTNLADGKFIKFGIGLQLPAGTVVDTVKTDNPGAPAVSFILAQLRKKSVSDLGPQSLEPLREQLGYQICTDEKLNAGGKITTIYFTDFVTQ